MWAKNSDFFDCSVQDRQNARSGGPVPRIDPAEMERISRDLGDAALDPRRWPAVMEEICRAIGATGAALLQADVRTPDIPRTPSVDQLFSDYFRDGWHTRDLRVRGAARLANGERVITDQ